MPRRHHIHPPATDCLAIAEAEVEQLRDQLAAAEEENTRLRHAIERQEVIVKSIADQLTEVSFLRWKLHDGVFAAWLDRGSILVYQFAEAWRAELWNAGDVVTAAGGPAPAEAYSALVAALPRHWAAWLTQQCQDAASVAASVAHDVAVGLRTAGQGGA